jgi:hypothetical protein
MTVSRKILLPKKLAKIYTTSSHTNYLAWQFGMHEIYLERVKPLYDQPMSSDTFSNPSISVVRCKNTRRLQMCLALIDKRLNAERVFKTAYYSGKKKEINKAFIYKVAKNFLHLTTGKTIRIFSKSSTLRDSFFKIFVEVNEEEKTKCKFDFDEYDVLLTIRVFKGKKKTIVVVTSSGIWHSAKGDKK